ncbi:MAG TPA: lysylphosphatidylglycerol synthase domain-containing protein [Methylomirabilota bacterium]|nr:lysylphosphatidylglycerol synthase domain-containing protein [Methylomirabilota bacterium]
MMKRIPWRAILAGLILVTTVVVFSVYFNKHPEVRHQLKHTPLQLLIILLGLYFLFTGCLALINTATLRLCKTSLEFTESLLLSMYSSVINFFGPLQSGPAFRALYLKQKHDVKLKDYTSATAVYYFFYALASGLLLLSGILHYWLLLMVVLALAAMLFVRHTKIERLQNIKRLTRGNWEFLAIASLLQVGLLVVIYFVELRAVMPSVGLDQVLIYTGAANLALFVSLTPGAIGFREAFLIFTQRLHHIDASTIIAANLIDRSVYIILLLILAAGIFGTHTNRRLKANLSK